MSEDEIHKDVSTAGTVAGAGAMAVDGVMGGAAGATADAILAGEGALATGAEVTAAGAAGAGVFAGASVVGAFALGYEVGTMIDNATGASDKWSGAAVDADPERAKDAADAWDRGDHLEAVGDFIVGSGEALIDKIEDIF